MHKVGILGIIRRQAARLVLGYQYARVALFKARMAYYVRLRRRLRTLDSPDAFRATIPHNLKSVAAWLPRMDLLFRPLSVIETLPAAPDVLIVGPRNEYDLILLASYGVPFGHIRGLDLISYSPKIDLGDMHAMPYATDSYDAVCCGWTLSYSATPAKAAAELVRVVKDGGIIAVGVEYSILDSEGQAALLGYAIQETERLAKRINSVEEILALFAPHVGEVYFRHDAPLRASHGLHIDATPSNVAVVFSVRKR